MVEKYYTPTIEEFHVGFEYEFKHPDYPEEGWVKWNTPEFNQEREDSHLGRKDLSDFRVKYLDIEDIKELGWDQSLEEPDEWFWGFNGDEDIQLYFDIIPKKNSVNGIVIYYGTEIIFKGYIKNKSELKKIMNHLNIS